MRYFKDLLARRRWSNQYRVVFDFDGFREDEWDHQEHRQERTMYGGAHDDGAFARPLEFKRPEQLQILAPSLRIRRREVVVIRHNADEIARTLPVFGGATKLRPLLQLSGLDQICGNG